MRKVSRHDRLMKLLKTELMKAHEVCPDMTLVVENEDVKKYAEFDYIEDALFSLRITGGFIRALDPISDDIVFEAEVYVQ